MIIYEYNDATEDIAALNQKLMTKKGIHTIKYYSILNYIKGFSKVDGNEWSSSIKYFNNEGVSWVENYGKNNNQNQIWYERWYESANGMYYQYFIFFVYYIIYSNTKIFAMKS